MLEHIKSKYILQIIFSSINDERKLILVKFNNIIKDRLNIDLIDYKYLSGKYFIGKKNGKGKEYKIFNDNLIFEGDFIDGKRYGYGKEYYEELYFGKVEKKYEGEYLNGKRNGKGIEYYYNGQIKFEGIYLLGLKFKGKGYDIHGKIIYELEDGKGDIKEVNIYNDIIFEGEYPNGKGKEYYYKKKNKI